jgi:hypothetical protein
MDPGISAQTSSPEREAALEWFAETIYQLGQSCCYAEDFFYVQNHF